MGSEEALKGNEEELRDNEAALRGMWWGGAKGW